MDKSRKVQYKSCRSIFDNNFKIQHEISSYNGKRVRTGGPMNPFVAANKNVQALKNTRITNHN